MNKEQLKKASHLAFLGTLFSCIASILLLIGVWMVTSNVESGVSNAYYGADASGDVAGAVGGGVITILGSLLGIAGFVLYFIGAIKYPSHVAPEDKSGATLFLVGVCLSLAAAVFFFASTFSGILSIASTVCLGYGFYTLSKSTNINAKTPFLILAGAACLSLLNAILSIANVGDITAYIGVVAAVAVVYAWKQIEKALA